ncbi:MAG: class I SAM-dependent methyltransferase [Holophagaceae bacterium]|nr:class I SAM-dependent methyltransferase [Holophagaceae bacterium]
MTKLVFPEKIFEFAEAYLHVLDKWNKIHSLTALKIESRFEALLLDSSALLPHLESVDRGCLVADFGSGIGIPAVVIAAYRPDIRVVAVDRNHKKIAFVKQVGFELKLGNLQVLYGPIESLPSLNADLGTAKAVGAIGLMQKWWKRHSAPGAPFFAFKGPKLKISEKKDEWSYETFPYQLPNLGKRQLIKFFQND